MPRVESEEKKFIDFENHTCHHMLDNRSRAFSSVMVQAPCFIIKGRNG